MRGSSYPAPAPRSCAAAEASSGSEEDEELNVLYRAVHDLLLEDDVDGDGRGQLEDVDGDGGGRLQEADALIGPDKDAQVSGRTMHWVSRQTLPFDSFLFLGVVALYQIKTLQSLSSLISSFKKVRAEKCS